MRYARCRAVRAVQGSCAVLLAAALGAPAPAGAYVTYYWLSGVSGLASDATKWSPNGVPALSDRLYFNPSGTYTVTFSSSTPQTGMLTCWQGNVTLKMTSPHTTSAFTVTLPSPSHSLTLDQGTLNIDYLLLGDAGGHTVMYVSGDTRANTTATVHSNGTGNPYNGGDQVGHDGISDLYLNGGGRYICERTGPATGAMTMAYQPFSAATLSITGSGGLPSHASSLSLTGGATLVVGVEGSANVFVTNKGILDATGDIVIAHDPAAGGAVTVGTLTSTSNAYLNAHAGLYIGGNQAAANSAGHGQLFVKNKGIVTVTGACEVGDPDNDGGSALVVEQGGTFTAQGGLKVWPTAAGGIDLQGGLTHVQGGAFDWPAGKYLSLSSVSGTPELRIDNGVTNTGPDTPAFQAQLYVARGGDATLTVSGAGTVFSMGPGSTVVADSVGGTGAILVDSSGTFSSAGPMNVGNRGVGDWYLQGGSTGDVGTLAVGVSAGGIGTVQVLGTGSQLQVRDELWIGGGYNGAGGSGLVSVGLGGRLDLLHTGGVNPALAALYAGGNLSVASGGVLATTGNVSNAGSIVLSDGEIEALTVTGTGDLVGYGHMTTMLKNAGSVDPSASGGTGTIEVAGSYEQFAQGKLTVDLDTAGGPQSDRIAVDGPATLAGTLNLRPAPGFSPAPGESFTLLTCTSLTGTFDVVMWDGQPFGGQVVLVYSQTDVRAVAPGATAAGEPDVTAPASIRFATIGGVDRPGFALELPRAAQVRIQVYDVRGREAATLFDGGLPAGRRSFALEAGGRVLPSGVYYGRAVIRSDARPVVRSASAVLVR